MIQTPGEDDNLAELKKKLDELDLPEEARAIVNKELKNLSRLKPSHHEYANIETYLDTIADLPWRVYDEENNDIANAKVFWCEESDGPGPLWAGAGETQDC